MHFQTPTWHAAFNNTAINAARLFGMPAELIHRQSPFAARLRQRLPGFQRDASRGFFGALLHDRCSSMQNIRPRPGSRRTPEFQTRLSRMNGGLNIGNAGRRNRPEMFARRRINHIQLSLPARSLPGPIDKKAKITIHRRDSSKERPEAARHAAQVGSYVITSEKFERRFGKNQLAEKLLHYFRLCNKNSSKNVREFL